MEEFRNAIDLTTNSYDVVAQKYHDLFKDELTYKLFDRKLLETFARNFNFRSKIYDMGCGPSGHIGKFLFDHGYDVTGVDISLNCVSIASEYNPGMKFGQMDMSKLDIEDESIDGIIAYYSIIHIPKQYVSIYFKEFQRVLAKGGKLLVSVKSGNEEGYVENFLESNTSIYFSHFIKSEIKNYFLENGFAINSINERIPYDEEIDVKRIYAIGERV